MEHTSSRHDRQHTEDGEQLTRHPDGVEEGEEGVPAPGQEVWDLVNEGEGVVPVSDYLGDTPATER